MNQFYTIFDMSHLEDKGYLQIGIGKVNPEDVIGKQIVDAHRSAQQNTTALIILVIALIVGLVVLGVFVVLRERKLKKDGQIDTDHSFYINEK